MTGSQANLKTHDTHTVRILSKNLRALREHHDYTLDQLAEYCRVTAASISKIERGLNWPAPEIIDKLASLYKIRIESLFRPGGAAEKAFDSISATKVNALEIVSGMIEAGEVNFTFKDGQVQLSLAKSRKGGKAG